MNSQEKPAGSAWSFKNFRLFTYSAFLMPFAAQSQSLIIGWQVFELKHDPLYLGLIGLTEALPALSLALYAGYVVDKSNPLTIYRYVIGLGIFSALLLLLASSGWITVSVDLRLGSLYFAAFLAGVARGFRMPANTALVPRLVPREALHVSSAWTTSGFSMASAAGPALAGFLYAAFGPGIPYAINFCAFLIAFFLFIQISLAPAPPNPVNKNTSLDNLTAGLRYVFSHRLLIAVLSLDMFAVLFGGAVALLPVFAGEILRVGPTGLGILRASASVGAMLGSLCLIRYPVRKNSGAVLLIAVAGFGFCMIGFGLSKNFLLSVGLLALGGIFDSVSMVIRGAIVQLSAPPEMRGRVGAVNSIFIGVSNQLGEFESGVMAALMGTAPSVVFGGILTLGVVVAITKLAPQLRSMHLSKL